MSSEESERANELFQAQIHIYNHIFNYMNSMALKCAIQLGIADEINKHAKPITLPCLVSALNIDPAKTSCLYRLMRLLVHSGFFTTTKAPNGHSGGEEEAYILTPSSSLLVKDHPNSLSPFILSLLNQEFFDPWHCFGDWLKGDELTAFEKAHGMPFWEYNDKNPEFHRLFNEAMACDSQMMNLIIGECRDIFEGLDSLVDVGGGTGSLARILSNAFPHMKCTVLEIPAVIANLESSENLKFVGGDMFQHIPSADAVLLKLIMHGWSDEDCVKILKKSKEAIQNKGKGGKVIIIDLVINDKTEVNELTETKLLFDLLMMVVVTGKERTEKEWERLFLEAGFSHYKIFPILGLRSLIEVYP